MWPVENATFALGLKRYGFDDLVERLVTAQFAAAGYFHELRLPESLGGHGRDEAPAPTLYPGSNSPQAWSASAVVLLVQAMLGLFPFAPARLLALVRPRLPSWIDFLELARLRVGDGLVTLRFFRRRDGTTAHEVVERSGRVRVVSAPPPNAPDGEERRPLERLKACLLYTSPSPRDRG